MSDIDSDWGAGEATTVAYTDGGLAYETVSTGSDSFYKAEDWLTPSDVLGVTHADDSHYGIEDTAYPDIDAAIDKQSVQVEQG